MAHNFKRGQTEANAYTYFNEGDRAFVTRDHHPSDPTLPPIGIIKSNVQSESGGIVQLVTFEVGGEEKTELVETRHLKGSWNGQRV